MLVNIRNFPEGDEERIVDVEIHDFDSWNADSTLAYIILPVLKQLKETKHGSPWVDNEDLPEHMRTIHRQGYFSGDFRQETLDFGDETEYNELAEKDFHGKWNYILDEMIWAFEQIQPENDWEDQYWLVKPELDLGDVNYDENGNPEVVDSTPIKWKVKGECDWDGRQKHRERITNGLKLFGRYYEALWD